MIDKNTNRKIITDKEDFLHRKGVIERSLYGKIIQLKMKRLVDITLSAVLIVLFSPLFIVISLIIKISSKGPIFYANKRIGLFGKHFHCLKFRSMISKEYLHSESIASFIELKNKGILFKPKQDKRVTSIGKIIRKTSIDELPQLFNVLKGDMSIVGPRPLVPFMLDHLEDFNNIRSLLKPGITGKWQIENRINNTSAEYMIKPDLHYIESFSLITDLKIILKTPKVVLNADGAY